jgi:hypothetical protein
VGVRSLGLTQLWTESHSRLWLEGKASQAQRDPATNRTAAGYDKVLRRGNTDMLIYFNLLLMILGGLLQYSG